MKRYFSLPMFLILAALSFLLIVNHADNSKILAIQDNPTLDVSIELGSLTYDDNGDSFFLLNHTLVWESILIVLSCIFPLSFTNIIRRKVFIKPIFYQSNYVITRPTL
jgi:hypothetical protein